MSSASNEFSFEIGTSKFADIQLTFPPAGRKRRTEDRLALFMGMRTRFNREHRHAIRVTEISSSSATITVVAPTRAQAFERAKQALSVYHEFFTITESTVAA